MQIYALCLEKHCDNNTWINRNHPKKDGKTEMPLLAFAFQTKDATVLFDTGTGEEGRKPGVLEQRLGSQISVTFETPNVMEYLKYLKIRPTHLALSHFHFDHAGWIDEIISEYHPEIIFYDTEITAMVPKRKKSPYFYEELTAILKMEGLLKDREIVPGILARYAPGHTLGHMILEIQPKTSGQPKIILAADAAFSVDNLEGNLPDPLMAANTVLYLQTNKTLLEQQDFGASIIMSHDPLFYSDRGKFLQLFGNGAQFIEEGKFQYIKASF
jgi:glyoxylase-like metal-dependent hydrolase (beta-lactamase superfamily II)